jgi:hypothetical protein
LEISWQSVALVGRLLFGDIMKKKLSSEVEQHNMVAEVRRVEKSQTEISLAKMMSPVENSICWRRHYRSAKSKLPKKLRPVAATALRHL